MGINFVEVGWGGIWLKCGRYCIFMFVFCIGGVIGFWVGIKVIKLFLVVWFRKFGLIGVILLGGE